MVMVGIDVHKRTHTAVAVDEVGRKLAECTVHATEAGHRRLLAWARQVADGELRFAVEDCRQVSTRLERALLGADVSVVRVPPKLMAGARASARTRGKSDPIDALAIARVALREPDLPLATLDTATAEIKLLVGHRDDLVGVRTGFQNRLRWLCHRIDADLEPAAGALDRVKVLDELRARLTALPGCLDIDVALDLIERIRELTITANALEKKLRARVEALAPQLLSVPGCATLTAAKVLAETANAARFRSEAAFAMHAGVAPVPASSGNTHRHRLARGGNRQLNAALHRIAITQIRLDGAGRTYYQRRRSEGKTRPEALRALKRHLARVIYNLLRTPPKHRHNTPPRGRLT